MIDTQIKNHLQREKQELTILENMKIIISIDEDDDFSEEEYDVEQKQKIIKQIMK